MNDLDRLHRSFASIEIPSSLFVKSIDLMYQENRNILKSCGYSSIDLNELTVEAEERTIQKYYGNWARYPSINLICHWWNTKAPNKSMRNAGSFYISVREDNGKYYQQVGPEDDLIYTEQMNIFQKDCRAYLGDYLLITFLNRTSLYRKEPGFNHFYVDSVDEYQHFDAWGENPEEADFAYKTYRELRKFSLRFSSTWSAIKFTLKGKSG